MTYTIELIERHLLYEKSIRERAKRLLKGPDFTIHSIAKNSLNLANERIPQLRLTLNFLVMGKAQWYRKRVRPHNNRLAQARALRRSAAADLSPNYHERNHW